MRRSIFIASFGLLIGAAIVAGVDVSITISKIDTDNNQITVTKGGREKTASIAKDVKVLGTDGKPLAGGIKAKELKEGMAATITIDRDGGGMVVTTIRLGGQTQEKEKGKQGGPTPKASTGYKPLTEMSAADKYKGEDGGLYGGGKNEPTGDHAAAAKKEIAKIVPLDRDGKPAANGTIGLISISMSNATQEFSTFVPLADADPTKSPRVKVVDCAQGGQAMAQWVNPSAKAWQTTDQRLQQAGVSPKQVQAVWIKLANVSPSGDLQAHGRKLEKDTLAVIQNAKTKFPNLRVAYLGSRIYAGYAKTGLNPEPYAYEGAFACRWLIQDQIKGKPESNYDSARGEVKAPLLLWGPYLWADGTTPRKSDGLVWERQDLVERDGTHPSDSGKKKVADMLLKFFKTDPYASPWFVKK